MATTSRSRRWTTAAVCAIALGFGTLNVPAEAGTITMAPIPDAGGGDFYDLDLVSTGAGDAVAAVAADGRITLHTAVDGAWVGHAKIPPVVVIDDVKNKAGDHVRLAVNGLGKVAVTWKDPTGRLWASRQVDATHWSTPTAITTGRVRADEFDRAQ